MMNANLTVGQLKELVKGESSLDHNFLIQNFTSLEKAGPGDLAIYLEQDGGVFDSLSLDFIKKSSAGLILASKPWVEGKNYLLVKDPLLAFQKIAQIIQFGVNGNDNASNIHSKAYLSNSVKVGKNTTVSAFAVIEDEAEVGEGTFVGSQTFIGKNCKIGSNVILHSGVKILDCCIVGDYTIVHSGAVIGSDGYGYRVRKDGIFKVPQLGIVRVGKHVEIGANTTIDRAAFDETVIGDGVKLDNLVHVAHNVKIGPHTAILAQTGIAGSVTIGMGCQIGGQVAIKNDLKIGNGVKIVSKSAVMKNLKDGEVVAGIPSVSFGLWKRLSVCLTKLPDIVKLAKFVESQKTKKSFWKKLLGWFCK